MSRRLALVVTLASASVACASVQPSIVSAPDPASLYGTRVHKTSFEDPSASDSSSAPAVASGPQRSRHTVDEDDPSDNQRTRTGFFWGGIATTAIGAGMLAAFGIGGRVTQAQLKKGYDDGSLTYGREQTLQDRGKVFNKVAGAGAGIALIGAAVALIVYGVDYSRCGTIARRRKDCRTKAK